MVSSEGRAMSVTAIVIGGLLAATLVVCFVFGIMNAGTATAARNAAATSAPLDDSTQGSSPTTPTPDPDRVSDQPVSTSSASPETQVEPEAPQVYLIERGDTLAEISGEVGVSVDRLVNTNEIADPNLIYADSALQVPQD